MATEDPPWTDFESDSAVNQAAGVSSSPAPNSSNAVVPAAPFNAPAVCLLRFTGESAADALLGSFFGYGPPQALLKSCLTFGAFSFIIEGLNKNQH